MQYYDNYVVVQRFKRQKNPICGAVNLPFGTECKTAYCGEEKAIVCDQGILCYVASQSAFDFFAQNDDGHGIERGKLTKNIIQTLIRLKQNDAEKANAVWDKIWNDSICLKYKRPEYADHWLWNYDFYNANLHDLQYIAKVGWCKMKIKNVIKMVVLLLIGGTTYFGIEMLWRGHSHWTMALVGGICFVLIGAINEYLPWELGMVQQAFTGASIVTCVELIAGLILNIWLKLGIWDYSNMPLNLWGQICLPFFFAWVVLSVIAIVIDDYLRYWLFNEEKPHYQLI